MKLARWVYIYPTLKKWFVCFNLFNSWEQLKQHGYLSKSGSDCEHIQACMCANTLIVREKWKVQCVMWTEHLLLCVPIFRVYSIVEQSCKKIHRSHQLEKECKKCCRCECLLHLGLILKECTVFFLCGIRLIYVAQIVISGDFSFYFLQRESVSEW